MRRLLLGCVGVALAACGPGADQAWRAHRAPIVGGTPALDDVQVFALGKNSSGMFCTATLIGERTLLTAAHCLDQGLAIAASNRADVKGWPADAIAVVDLRVHPKWAAGETVYDVGLLLLATAPGVKPKPWNRAPLWMDRLPQVRAVGFGETQAQGNGVRQQAMLDVTSLSSTTLYLGSPAGASTCFGDSGGPSLHAGPDGVERLVGVHAFANSAACNGGGDVRADRVADFIDQWTRDKAPTCATDGACVVGCAEQDLDCHCLTDGLCSAACPLPDTDRDCPKHCLEDGICAYGTCGVPDPDCLADGEPCPSADVCTGHQCLSGYCTRVCRSQADCTGQMQCGFGLCRFPVLSVAEPGQRCTIGQTYCNGGVCAGQSMDTATCRTSCGPQGACPASMTCVGGFKGVRYCQGTAVLEPLRTQLPLASSGCSAAGGHAAALFAVAGWLGLRRARRRR